MYVRKNQHIYSYYDTSFTVTSFGLQGTKATKYIQFHTKKFGPHIYLKGLRKMKKLRFLSVSAVQQLDFSSNLEFSIVVPADFPNTLRYLHWSCYPFRSLPTTFQANNLVALRMDDSRIVQLWEGGERKVKLWLIDHFA